jgi:hypothetical protein
LETDAPPPSEPTSEDERLEELCASHGVSLVGVERRGDVLRLVAPRAEVWPRGEARTRLVEEIREATGCRYVTIGFPESSDA